MRLTARVLRPTAVAAAALLVLAACGGGGESVDVDGESGSDGSGGSGSSGEVLVAAIAGEPDQLDPHSTTSYFSFQILENVFDTLVEPDENLEMQPALAESWETSEDQLTWTFQLREGVTWHDGSEFTADDVAYSFNRIIDEELAASWRFAAVESVTATDDLTVEIQVSAPSPNLLASIGGYKGVAIVQEENASSGDIATDPIGTGPFSFETYSSGQAVELAANPDYFGGEPAIGGVEFQFIAEASTALAALRSGEIHWTDNVPPQQVETLSGEDALEIGQVGSNDYWYLALNQGNEPWDQVEARQAIAYAIDREAITEATMFGAATVNQTAIPESSSWFTEYTTYSHDPDRALELFDEIGVDPASLTIDLMVTSEYPETVTAAQIISSQLEEVGITTTINTLDFGTWLSEQTEGNFDMLMLGWLGNIDPDDFYYSQHHSEGSNNHQGNADPELDELLDAGRTETDEAAREEIYDEVATRVADTASYIYLYNPDVVQAWSTDLSGYTALPDRAIRFRDAEIAD
ncbi:ABC transporter substrate-binding protein [Georgenia sp. Z1344]|uniref:ABC transporter substrate-binding protein n=1 Tax=Georgenia sp. Z1344 TaxID=3416706 RepID=UPI003CF2913C